MGAKMGVRNQEELKGGGGENEVEILGKKGWKMGLRRQREIIWRDRLVP